ncbi:MAG: ABC transporter ATP-binding protein [Desulfobacteraceae bacterium 4572_19]|nr:MAG: ABC transporter ATP-binding protein [Desulfobacteraceae bacterium 4572_19]
MISIENITKSFGENVLFKGTGFKINSRERVGIVGKNGHGKTTLLQIIMGKEYYDAGKILIPKNYRIGYVEQHLSFNEETVLKEAITGLCAHEKEQHWKVEKILLGLGFSIEDMQRHPNEFSGGFQVRLNLAKILVSDPDLLLLDEPTNYLDIMSIRWIEQFLINWPHELILITHDRGFMDKVVTHTVGIHRKKMRKITGSTEKYYDQIAQDEEVYEKTRINDEKHRKEIEKFIGRFRAKARLAGLVQSRIKNLAKLDKKGKLENIKTLDFSFRSKSFKGKQVANIKNLDFSYTQDTPLIKNLSFTVYPGDRICVVGKNGKGKTTLLKLIANSISPNKGEISFHPEIVKGIYEQTNVQTLNSARTVEEELCCCHPDVERQHARSICGAMMFEGDMALKKISVLSGGEKSRVMLGKLLVTPLNLLLLDEPTNHLDMESCDAMLAALSAFDGSVIMVTHNEMFLHAIANRLVVFKDDKTEIFEGTYGEFLEKGGWDDGDSSSLNKKNRSKEEKLNCKAEKLNKKILRRKRSEIVRARSNIVKPFEKKISKLENSIDSKERTLSEMNKKMQEITLQGDGKKIGELSVTIHNCQTQIDKLFDELEEVTLLLEGKSAKFDKQLEALE